MNFAASALFAQALNQNDVLECLWQGRDVWMDTLLPTVWVALVLLLVFFASFVLDEKGKETRDAGTDRDEWFAQRLKQDLYWCSRGKDGKT